MIRRAFLRNVAAGTTAAAAVNAAAAQDPKPDDANAQFEAEVDGRMAVILARYGPQLDDDARELIREDVRALVRRGSRLKEFALDNGDGPFPVFTPYRAPLTDTPRILPA